MRLRATDRRGGKGLTALLLALAVVIAGLQLPERTQAMVGGAPPAPAEFAHSVVMILGSSGTACTATAIGRDLLLTAAHCVQPGADYNRQRARAAGRSQDHHPHRTASAI